MSLANLPSLPRTVAFATGALLMSAGLAPGATPGPAPLAPAECTPAVTVTPGDSRSAAPAGNDGIDPAPRDDPRDRSDRVSSRSEENDAPRTRPTRKPAGADEAINEDDEWTKLEQFMLMYSPNKWQMYQNLSDKPLKQGLRKQIAQRFRMLQRVERSDPFRWKMETDAIAIEDQIYATLQELRVGNDIEVQEQRLRIEVDRLIANRDSWRRERLLRVKAELESLKLPASLKPVEEEIDRLNKITPEARVQRVEKRIEDFKKHMDPRPLLGGRSPASEVPADPK